MDKTRFHRSMLITSFLLFSISAQGESTRSNDLGGQLPKPVNLSSWISWDDVRTDTRQNGDQGTVNVRISVDSSGHVYRCEITSSSKSAGLDEATCKGAWRSRFKPARDEHGKPIVGDMSVSLHWINRNAREKSTRFYERVDIVLSVSKLPPSGSDAVMIKQIVEADGSVTSCSGSNHDADKILARAACNFLKGREITPVKDDAGLPVRAVVGWRIGFSSETTEFSSAKTIGNR